ncbi:MAG: PIN domain-containing protein [Acidobacteriota bacterium]|jgi:predicted nucleic acid-binding protein|nr:PIN domain-containing protein [Acidobacteriota bacterium]
MAGDKKKLNIYLDNCCYNRPYDDQEQLRIELETKAKLFIQDLIVQDKVDLTVSSISVVENDKNPFEDRKEFIADFYKNAKKRGITSETVKKDALLLKDKGLKLFDALHLAFAIAEGCDYFLTTDDKLLKFQDNRIAIVNPIEFLIVWERHGNDE